MKDKIVTYPWKIVEKQRVVDKYVKRGFFTDGILTWKYEYIIKNQDTGELKRI